MKNIKTTKVKHPFKSVVKLAEEQGVSVTFAGQVLQYVVKNDYLRLESIENCVENNLTTFHFYPNKHLIVKPYRISLGELSFKVRDGGLDTDREVQLFLDATSITPIIRVEHSNHSPVNLKLRYDDILDVCLPGNYAKEWSVSYVKGEEDISYVLESKTMLLPNQSYKFESINHTVFNGGTTPVWHYICRLDPKTQFAVTSIKNDKVFRAGQVIFKSEGCEKKDIFKLSLTLNHKPKFINTPSHLTGDNFESADIDKPPIYAGGPMGMTTNYTPSSPTTPTTTYGPSVTVGNVNFAITKFTELIDVSVTSVPATETDTNSVYS